MKRFFVVSLVGVFISGLILSVYATPAPAQKPIELSITYHFPTGSIEDRQLNRWTKKVEKDSKGRLKFKIYGAGVLVNAFETYFAVPKGIADIGAGYRYGKGAPFTDELFATALMGTPNVATSSRIVDDFRKKYPTFYEKEWGDTKLLWLHADPASLPISTKPIRTPKDANGMEVRAPIKPLAEAWKAMGAKPTSMPMSDFVIGLQKGTVDAGTTTIINIRSFKMQAVIKYCTEFGIVAAPSWYFVMNLDKWKALPPDLQKVLEDASEWGRREMVKMLDDETESAKKYAIKEGVEFITLTPAQRKEWVSTIGPVYLKQAQELDAKGYPASEAFKFVQERLEQYTK